MYALLNMMYFDIFPLFILLLSLYFLKIFSFPPLTDLCVGAPYDGEDKNGAIYLYHGSSEGIITDPTQVLFFL